MTEVSNSFVINKCCEKKYLSEFDTSLTSI